MHIPVLLKEVIQYLNPQPNENFIDCTFGQGGHSLAILEKNGPNGKVLGIECDKALLKEFEIRNSYLAGSPRCEAGRQAKFENRLILTNDNYANLENIVKEENFGQADGILFDLGISSWHFEESGRGFSFRKDEPLDMRYQINQNEKWPLTAKEIINKWPERKITEILKEYGQERLAERIAKTIIIERGKRRIETGKQLAEIIEKAVGLKKGKIHPATKTFQALRIMVNQELENLKKVLPQTMEVLKPGGRLAAISFHSLEDKIVKNFYKELAQKNSARIITPKPIGPISKETVENPASRSARLRVAIRL